MFFVTSACARRTGAGDVADVSAEHCLQCEAGELAGVIRAASQAFERMHDTLRHRVKNLSAPRYSFNWWFSVSLIILLFWPLFSCIAYFAAEAVVRKPVAAAAVRPKDKKIAKLLVKNLAFEATKKNLQELFGAFGQVRLALQSVVLFFENFISERTV